MCDIRIGSTKAQFGEDVCGILASSPATAAHGFCNVCSAISAAELALTGRMPGGRSEKALGILLEITEPDALLTRARESATKHCRETATCSAVLQSDCQACAAAIARRASRCVLSFQAICHKTDDHQEALTAFPKSGGKLQGPLMIRRAFYVLGTCLAHTCAAGQDIRSTPVDEGSERPTWPRLKSRLLAALEQTRSTLRLEHRRRGIRNYSGTDGVGRVQETVGRSHRESALGRIA